MRVLAFICVALAMSCASDRTSERDAGGSDLVGELAAWMTGSFSSAAQAESSPDDYFDIRLEMVPIWLDREDGPWLYVEQAAASALERPYRQRVYRLVPVDDGVRSDVYLLPDDPLAWAGAWSDPSRFDTLSPNALPLREGCSISLVRDADGWTGSTVGAECASSLRGAAYATSEVVITADVLESWDRGYDESGEQVWGAEKGPYVFERRR